MAGVSGQMLRARGGDIVVVVQSGCSTTSQGARGKGQGRTDLGREGREHGPQVFVIVVRCPGHKKRGGG